MVNHDTPPPVRDCPWSRGGEARPECRECGLYRRGTHPFIPPVVEAPDQPVDLVIVGEAPGVQEDRRGEPFVGQAGLLLDRLLEESRWGDSNVAFTNAVQCWPGRGEGGDAKPTMAQVRCCRPLLLENLARLRPRAVLAVGQWAIRALTDDGQRTVSRVRGGRLRDLEIADWPGPGPAPPCTATYHPAAVFRRQPQLARVIRQDLDRFYQVVHRREVVKLPTLGELEPGKLESLGQKVALDTEYNPETGELYSLAVYDGDRLLVAPVQRMVEGSPRLVREYRECLSRWLPTLRELRGHNLSADLLALARWGVRLPGFMRLSDSLTRARVLWENEPDRSLEIIARSKLGFPDYSLAIRPWKRSNPHDFGAVAPWPVLAEYNAWDAYASWMLIERTQGRCPPNLLRLLDRKAYYLMLATLDGQQIDRKALASLTKAYTRRVERGLQRLRRLTGIKDYAPATKAGREYPWKTLDWEAQRRGVTGPSLDEHVLRHYALHGDARSKAYAEAMLEYRDAMADLARLRRGFVETQDARGRIHPEFRTAAAATLRDSSANPNFQSVTPALRAVIVSRWPQGWITQADLRGLEPRIMADVTQCRLLLDIFGDPQRENRVYEILGREILGRPIVKEDAEGRKTQDYRMAKEIILATNYNAVPYTLAQRLQDALGLTVEERECARWIRRYFAAAPEIREYITARREEVLRTQQVRCQTGFIRHLPHFGEGDPWGSVEDRARAREFKHVWNQAVNVDIQHTASMLAKLWALQIQENLRRKGYLERGLDNVPQRVVYLGPVHDSVSHDVRDSSTGKEVMAEYEAALGQVQGAPVRGLLGRPLRVKLSLEAKRGKTWRLE